MRNWDHRELLAYLDRVIPALDELDHFELLDVDAEADTAAIVAAFHDMASGLHPDRHRQTITGADRERLTTVYARIAEAYRVLRNPVERERYLRDQARKQGAAPPLVASSSSEQAAIALLSPKAQRLYRRARAALATGDRASARLNLRMALAQHPTSTFLRDALREAGPDA